MCGDKITIVLVGIGGYGGTYVKAIEDQGKEHNVECVGVVDPMAEQAGCIDTIKSWGCPVYNSLDEFYASHSADLAIISAPIHFHAPLSIKAMENGSDVLCEKPITATIDEVLAIKKTCEKTGKITAVGYQWSYSEAIGKLKKDILSGRFGAAKRLKTVAFWGRDSLYYERNNWAGKMKTPKGDWILDSPASNATAHYLHNMFFVLGDTMETSCDLKSVRAELFRAKEIETFDTAAIHCRTLNGVDIHFYTTHSPTYTFGPIVHYEFEEADIYYGQPGVDNFYATLKNGETIVYGNPNAGVDRKVWSCVDYIRTGKPVECDVITGSRLTVAVNAAHESMPEIIEFPKELIQTKETTNGGVITYVESILPVFIHCYDKGLLPSELGFVDWATRTGDVIDVENYSAFPSFASDIR